MSEYEGLYDKDVSVTIQGDDLPIDGIVTTINGVDYVRIVDSATNNELLITATKFKEFLNIPSVISTLIGLSDTPSGMGTPGQILVVNGAQSALEFKNLETLVGDITIVKDYDTALGTTVEKGELIYHDSQDKFYIVSSTGVLGVGAVLNPIESRNNKRFAGLNYTDGSYAGTEKIPALGSDNKINTQELPESVKNTIVATTGYSTLNDPTNINQLLLEVNSDYTIWELFAAKEPSAGIFEWESILNSSNLGLSGVSPITIGPAGVGLDYDTNEFTDGVSGLEVVAGSSTAGINGTKLRRNFAPWVKVPNTAGTNFHTPYVSELNGIDFTWSSHGVSGMYPSDGSGNFTQISSVKLLEGFRFVLNSIAIVMYIPPAQQVSFLTSFDSNIYIGVSPVYTDYDIVGANLKLGQLSNADIIDHVQDAAGEGTPEYVTVHHFDINHQKAYKDKLYLVANENYTNSNSKFLVYFNFTVVDDTRFGIV